MTIRLQASFARDRRTFPTAANGASTTSYRYRTARMVAAPPATTGETGGGGTSALLIIALLAAGGLVALGGLTVLWAHL